MPSSKKEKEFVSYVVDLMQSIGSVKAKAMFGGYGIFLKGLMFGLIADNVLYLKADIKTENEFQSRELEIFTYNKKGKTFKMSYYHAPAEVLENNGEMHSWTAKAYSAARRAASKKCKKQKKA